MYNKETGEHCLPQDRCRLSEESAPATQNRLISPAESFEATAKRALWEQTGYTCDLSGSHNRRTLQPGRRSLLACVAPTLDKTEINNAGVLKVTTWYEATVDTMASRNLYGSSLGEDWDSKWISYFDDHLSPDEVVVVKESRAVSENEEDSW